jgi:PAS domain S-box-containing protein
MADLAYTVDREGRFIYGNQKFLQVLGRTLDQVVGRNVFDLHYPAGLAERLHDQILSVIATGKPVKDETVFVSAAGESEIHEYIFNPVFADDGTVKAVAGTTRFITQRKEEEKALKEAKETAEAANRAKDRFLAVLSHELRTPLTPVMMTVSALEMDPELPPSIRADMSMIRRNVELETKLIDDLLDLSRIVSSKLALRLEPVDLNEVVREACAICRPQMLEKSIRLEQYLQGEPLPVMVDSARFQQVLWNVLKNAVKFTPEQGVIRVATRRGADDRAEVVIEDSGMGIAPELLTKIFDAFEQGDPSITRAFGGLGLGLAISRALMELHGGSISAASDGNGKGAVFTVALPVYAGAPAHEISGPAPPPESHPQKLRLLVVEDHADTARTLGLLLRRAGFVVTTAGDVSTALRLADAQAFDMLISDVGLPDGTGFELMKQMAKNHALPGIAMSGFGLESDVAKSLEAGFREHLVKPVRVAQLEQAIRRVMAKG